MVSAKADDGSAEASHRWRQNLYFLQELAASDIVSTVATWPLDALLVVVSVSVPGHVRSTVHLSALRGCCNDAVKACVCVERCLYKMLALVISLLVITIAFVVVSSQLVVLMDSRLQIS